MDAVGKTRLVFQAQDLLKIEIQMSPSETVDPTLSELEQMQESQEQGEVGAAVDIVPRIFEHFRRGEKSLNFPPSRQRLICIQQVRIEESAKIAGLVVVQIEKFQLPGKGFGEGQPILPSPLVNQHGLRFQSRLPAASLTGAIAIKQGNWDGFRHGC